MATKRVNGEGSIRKRENGTWEARVTVNGKRKSVYGKTRREVADKLAKIKAEVTLGTYVDSSSLTLEGWIKKWLSAYCLSIKDSTRRKYSSDLSIHIIPIIGDISLQKITADDVQCCYKKMLDDGLKMKTVNNVHSTLHKVFQKAVAINIIPRNPVDACSASRGKRPQIQFIPDDKIRAFLNACEGSKYKEILYFLLFTGVRRSEAIGLTWDCIDFKRGYIHVYRQYVEGVNSNDAPHFSELKNKKERTFKAADSVIEMLRVLRNRELQNREIGKGIYSNEQDFVFVTSDGKPIKGHVLYDNFKRIATKIGMPTLRLHDLRHTFATLAIQNNVDVKTVSTTLGHATTAFTLDIYAHVSEFMQNNAAQKIDTFIKSL